MNCDICNQLGMTTAAAYDAKTKMGQWAYLCEAHFIRCGVNGEAIHNAVGLGTGKEQKLERAESSHSLKGSDS